MAALHTTIPQVTMEQVQWLAQGERYGTQSAAIQAAVQVLYDRMQVQEAGAMTRTVVARGAEWSDATLGDGWGDVEGHEDELAALVVARFHELAEQHGGGDLHWTPYTGEVTGEVYGEGERMWERAHPLDCEESDLLEQARGEVWEAVIGDGGPMADRVHEVFGEDEG